MNESFPHPCHKNHYFMAPTVSNAFVLLGKLWLSEILLLCHSSATANNLIEGKVEESRFALVLKIDIFGQIGRFWFREIPFR